MSLVRLTQNKVALIDDDDLHLVEGHAWCAQQARHHWYAITYIGRTRVSMHRLLLAAPKGVMVDHLDGDGLNNQRSNLRLSTNAQNQQNRRVARGASQFKGVSWNKRISRWRATIKLDGRTKELGHYRDEAEAARAYDRAASEHYGSFACTNEDLGLYDGPNPVPA